MTLQPLRRRLIAAACHTFAIAALLAAGSASAAPDPGQGDPQSQKQHGFADSTIPGYPGVVGEYLQIPGSRTDATPEPLDTAAFLRVRALTPGGQADEADAVVLAMPGFSSFPSHWIFLAAQLVQRSGERQCGANDNARSRTPNAGRPCRVEVWIVDRRGSNLEDTIGLNTAHQAGDPMMALDYYFGRSVLNLDPELPGVFPTSPPPQFLTGRPDSTFRPLEQGDVRFMSEWGFEAHAGDVDRMLALIRAKHGAKNVFLAGHSQGGAFVANYAGRLQPDGTRGHEKFAGLIFLDGGPAIGSASAPSAAQWQTYLDSVNAWRSGAQPVFTNGTGPLPNYNGPGPGSRTSMSGVFIALKGLDAESISRARQTGALPTSPAGDAFLKKLRLTNLSGAGMGIDTDPLPGRGLQNATIVLLGEGLGQLDFTPVQGTEALCDPLSPPTRCMPHVAQVDPTKVYGWREGGGGGTVTNEVGSAKLYAQSLAYSPTRTNVQPVTVDFALSGRRTIDASYMNPATWYPSNRYDADMTFVGGYQTMVLDQQGVHFDIDKRGIATPVYVARQNTVASNPFPLVTDFTEVNRSGTTQSEAAKALSPIDATINTTLYKHTDFVSADDSLPAHKPGTPGSSVVAGTLVDWMLNRATGRADMPSPQSLGVRPIR